MNADIVFWLTISPLILIVIGVVFFRQLIGKRLVENEGNTYSQQDYDKKVKYLGWTFVGLTIGFFGGSFAMLTRLAPPIVRDESMEVLPWALGVFIIGLFIFAMSLFSSAKIKGVKNTKNDKKNN